MIKPLRLRLCVVRYLIGMKWLATPCPPLPLISGMMGDILGYARARRQAAATTMAAHCDRRHEGLRRVSGRVLQTPAPAFRVVLRDVSRRVVAAAWWTICEKSRPRWLLSLSAGFTLPHAAFPGTRTSTGSSSRLFQSLELLDHVVLRRLAVAVTLGRFPGKTYSSCCVRRHYACGVRQN
jgi:hypothetical protein